MNIYKSSNLADLRISDKFDTSSKPEKLTSILGLNTQPSEAPKNLTTPSAPVEVSTASSDLDMSVEEFLEDDYNLKYFPLNYTNSTVGFSLGLKVNFGDNSYYLKKKQLSKAHFGFE